MQNLNGVNKINVQSNSNIETANHIIYDGVEYVDLGYDIGSKNYQLMNVKSNALKKLNNHEYA